jgi:hypothetical protein
LLGRPFRFDGDLDHKESPAEMELLNKSHHFNPSLAHSHPPSQKQKRPVSFETGRFVFNIEHGLFAPATGFASSELGFGRHWVALPQPALDFSIENEHGYTISGGIAPKIPRFDLQQRSEPLFPNN